MRRNHSPGYHKTSSSLTSNIYNQQNVEQHSVLSAPIPQRQYIPPYQNHSQSSLPLEHQQPLHHQSQTYNSNTSSSNSSHTYSNDYSYPPPQQQQQSYSLLPSTSSTKVVNVGPSSYNETINRNMSSTREFRQSEESWSSSIGLNNETGGEEEEIYDTRSRVPHKLDLTSIDKFLDDNSAHFQSSATPTFELTQSWSQHVVDEIQDWMHVLSPDAIIIFTTPPITDLTGWSPEEVTNMPLSNFIHPEDLDLFNGDYQLSLHEGKDLTLYYRFRMKTGQYRSFELTGHPYYGEELGQRKCHCFFGISRPYNSEIASVDSFLELKSENSDLRQEIQSRYQEIRQIEDRKARRGGSYSAYARPQKPYHRRPQQAQETSGYNLMFKVDNSSSLPPPAVEKKKISRKMDTSGFVCTDCHITESPEWRKGPSGPKTLCNACGLRYAKTQSHNTRRQQSYAGKIIDRDISPTSLPIPTQVDV